MGPGPVNADPRVLAAMARPLVGQYDPFMTAAMNEAMALWRGVFASANEQTLLVDSTARGAIEAAFVSVLRPGDRVVIPVAGRFGHLLVEIARRVGASVRVVDAPWGEVVPQEAIVAAIREFSPALVAVVHGDTSTTVVQPLDGLREACDQVGALLYADVTATLGGNLFLTDAWGVDIATAGLQKCLGGPSGIAPATFSAAAESVIRSRASVEAGLAVDGDPVLEEPIRSNYFDMSMVFDYWGPRRLNHHTEATSMLYGAHEAARVVLEEGLDARVARHSLHGRAMAAGCEGLGLALFGDQDHKMTNIVAVWIPEGVDGEAVRAVLLKDFGIEIGTSFGPLAGRVWRIGTMGVNASREAIVRTLDALEEVLVRLGVAVPTRGGVDAAEAVYSSQGDAA